MLRRFFLLAILTAGLSSFAQVPAPPASPIPSATADHSQESYVVEKFQSSYRFENDGTSKRELYARIRVQSDAGVQQWAAQLSRGGLDDLRHDACPLGS